MRGWEWGMFRACFIARIEPADKSAQLFCQYRHPDLANAGELPSVQNLGQFCFPLGPDKVEAREYASPQVCHHSPPCHYSHCCHHNNYHHQLTSSDDQCVYIWLHACLAHHQSHSLGTSWCSWEEGGRAVIILPSSSSYSQRLSSSLHSLARGHASSFRSSSSSMLGEWFEIWAEYLRQSV